VRGGFGHLGITVPDVYEACARFASLGCALSKTRALTLTLTLTLTRRPKPPRTFSPSVLPVPSELPVLYTLPSSFSEP